MESPYQSPQAEGVSLEMMERSRRRWGWTAVGSGLFLIVTLVFAVSGVVRGMYGATRELQKTGSADPEALAGDISVAILSMFWSLIVSVPVFVLLVVSVVFYLKWRKASRRLITYEL